MAFFCLFGYREEDRLRDLLFRNISLKFLSLLFAISLWLFVNLKATSENTLQIPVLSENLPNFLVPTNPVNDSIRVQVSGPRRILSNLKPEEFPVVLDLSAAKVGLSNYQINEKMINMPPGISVTVLPPDTIQFKFELIVTKTIPIIPQIIGNPMEGYGLESVELTPKNIEIIGAQSEVQAISQIETPPIRIDNLREDFKKDVNMVLNQPHIWLPVNHEKVQIYVRFTEGILKKVFKQIPVKVKKNIDHRFIKIHPAHVNIIVEGLAGKVHSIIPDQIVASIIVSDIKRASSAPVIVELSEEDVIAKSYPKKVKVLRDLVTRP